MAAKAKNPVWAFLASVRLALLLLGVLASTSIIGTIIQQNKPAEHYVKAWGPSAAKVIQALNLDDMYNSGWFLLLLGAFSLNLTVCSIDRLPGVIRVARKDNLADAPEQVLKRKLQYRAQVSGSVKEGAQKAADWLAGKGWKTAFRSKEGGVLLFAQKGAWTRFGVYAVHISILIILLGAIIGSPTVAEKILKNPQFAFKGGVLLPEQRSTNRIFSYDEEEQSIPLGFTVRCNFFDIDFYDNGMPKDYVSGLTILEGDKEILTKEIEVNKPLKYKGVTFYQSSYNDLRKPVIRLKNVSTGERTMLPFTMNATSTWQNGKTQGMLRIQGMREKSNSVEFDIWFMDPQGPPSTFTVNYNKPVIVERPAAKYELKISSQFATGLQVSKDPGVWWVYGGCILMLLGLFVAFFMSHRKIWAYVHEENGQTTVVFIGQANKNSLGFAKTFTRLTEDFGDKQD
jgi:cytochrome c biogenesis protein